MIACLLPARNAEAEIGEWLEGVKVFADTIVALDDGSTDRTAELLRIEPAVATLLSNDERPGYSEWDDGANRRRLLAAAGELEPDWIVFLDADERIDAEDGEVLREFLEGDAIAPCAYGVTMFDEVAPGEVELPPRTVYRAFAWRAGLELPDLRFHFNPVPVSIPDEAYVPTTIRARHLASPERRAIRSAKYREADPAGDWGRDRRGPAPEVETTAWRPRKAGVPVLFPHGMRPDALAAGGSPVTPPSLACLLPIRNSEAEIEGYLDSVRTFADTVLALDDGSTDSHRRVAGARPTASKSSTPSRRAIRMRVGTTGATGRVLLDAARERGFDWVLYLDADERISPDDAAALRSLVEAAAEPDRAYGFRVFGMTGHGHIRPRGPLGLPALRHAAPPGISPKRASISCPSPARSSPRIWSERRSGFSTSEAARPRGGLREPRKYDEADPGRKWQASYANLTRQAGPDRRLAQAGPRACRCSPTLTRGGAPRSTSPRSAGMHRHSRRS